MYRADAMDARRQLHVAMKFAGSLSAFTEGQGGPLQGFALAISRMSPDDADFICNACLILVKRQDPSSLVWADVMTPQGQFMFDDLRTDLAAMMQLVFPVLEANVKGFLSALPSDLTAKLKARFPTVGA